MKGPLSSYKTIEKLVPKNSNLSFSEIHVYTPYNAEFVASIKKIGSARWNPEEKCWTVAADALDAARAIMMDVYGETDISMDNKVNVLITFNEDVYEIRGPVELFGKLIASASGKFSDVWIGEDVIVKKGHFSSGGSHNYWQTIVRKGCVIEVHNVNRNKLYESERFTVEIIEDAPVDVRALKQEKEKLMKRIAEIDSLIGET